ncbi:MAG: ACT domain-containing protein, partial [Deltaproteobacteria bacterium]|nr:ACT domain-containing protein [Deltaproteobacteria bacterium]
AGVALDVFEQEPPPRQDPLVQREEVIGTPHLGASTREAQVTVSVEIARQVVDYLLYGLIRNAVNVPSLSPELYPVLEPYLRLAEKLGEFQAQLIPAALDEVQVEYSGEVSEFEVAPLTVSLLKGLLSTAMPGSVNYVNAPVIARDRGIRVVESKSRTAADFASLVTLRVRSREGESTVAGTIFGRKEPRLVRIGSFELEAIPEGHLLVIQSTDRPGVIGHIGAVLGRNGINIAQMQLGRKRVGGEALSLIQIDSQAGPEVIDQLLRLPHINAVRPVEL